MKYNPGQQRVEAIYSKVQNPLHQGNPLIEALPEIKSKETLAAGLRMEIPFSEEQLQYPPEVRADLVGCTFSRNNPISSSFSIIGYSGMGKSSSVRNILAQIP